MGHPVLYYETLSIILTMGHSVLY